MCRTRGHADTHRIRARYVSDTPRGVSLTIYMVNDFGHGSNTVRTQLDYSDGERRWEAVDLVPGFNRRKKEEGRREKGEGRRGENESSAWGGGRE